MPDIMMRIQRLVMGDQQRVIVEASSRGIYTDEEVTWTVPAKEAKDLYIGQQVRVRVTGDLAEELPDQKPTPTVAYQIPMSVHDLYNVWYDSEADLSVHSRSMDAVRSGWPALGKALDKLLSEVVD